MFMKKLLIAGLLLPILVSGFTGCKKCMECKASYDDPTQTGGRLTENQEKVCGTKKELDEIEADYRSQINMYPNPSVTCTRE